MDVLLAGLGELLQPLRLAMLMTGVFLGLLVGVIPGLGGVFGLTLLVPLTYALDPMAAVALLLGLSSVTTTSDTIPAVLIGVPGTVGSAATVIDGHELARQGKAAQALGAAYAASLIGGVFGALLLATALPLMRPLVLLLNYGDLLAITVFGLTLVGLLTGTSWLRGILAALLGVIVSLVGLDPYSGAERWTFGNLHFWDGLSTAIVFLGLFGLSELASVLSQGKIARVGPVPGAASLLTGIRAALREWPLVLRSGALGSFLGAIPGIGVTVIEWIAYGSAARRPGDGPEFGKGNLRGVIAPESANNSKEGGALLPTLAFGIPGSATMAILLGAFAIHGIVPGPRLLENEGPLLALMILAIALANIVGTLVCIGLTPTLARLTQVPAMTLVPITLVFVVLGALYTNGSVADLGVLLAFGAVGIVFKRLGWSRPAFALGFVLGPNIERFFVLTYQISGWSWVLQPVVLLVAAIIIAGGLRRWRKVKQGQKARRVEPSGDASAGRADLLLNVFLAALLVFLLATVWPLPFSARLLPAIAIGIALVTVAALVVEGLARERGRPGRPPMPTQAGILQFPEAQLGAYLAGLFAAVLVFGHLVGSVLFVLATQAIAGGRWTRSLTISLAMGLVVFAIFEILAPRSLPEPLLHCLVP